jgi:hypothetical protein
MIARRRPGAAVLAIVLMCVATVFGSGVAAASATAPVGPTINRTIASSTARVPGTLARAAGVAGLRPLTIQTVPALRGVTFVLDGKLLTTGNDGAARTTTTAGERSALVANMNAHLRASLATFTVRPGVRASFGGWNNAGYHFDRSNKSGQLVLAAFNLDYLTSFSFVAPDRARVDPARIGSIALESSSGTKVGVSSGSQVWLRGTEVDFLTQHARLRETEYRIASVLSRGNNVVHSGEQSFVPSQDQRIDVHVLFFSVRFTVHDALFGQAGGSAIDLRFADGSRERYPLRNGEAVVAELPRGRYKVDVKMSGLNTSRDVSLSRAQHVDVAVFGIFDILIVLEVLVAIAAALLLTGWLRRRSLAERRARGVDIAEGHDGAEWNEPARV